MTERRTAPARQRVAVVHHFFPHYRAAVLRELQEHGRHEYFFVGDVDDPQPLGIRPWDWREAREFKRTRSRMLPGGVLWQTGLIRLALDPGVGAIVYLGDVHYATTWLSAALARLTGKRVLFWTIGWHRDEWGLKDFIRRTFYRLSSALLLYGHFARRLGIVRGFAPERLYVLFNSLDYAAQIRAKSTVDSSQVAATRAEVSILAGRPLLICVSRLVARRGVDLMLEAMVQLRDQGFPVNLLLVGDGPEQAKLEGFATQHQLAVRFYGACYDEGRLAAMVMAADATVAPGMVGLTAMQSLAYGTPVITHDDWNKQAPEWEAIIPGVGGVFFRFGDSNGLAQAVRKCVDQLGHGTEARSRCGDTIARFYNPASQREVIDRAVDGSPAEDTSVLLGRPIPSRWPPSPAAGEKDIRSPLSGGRVGQPQ